MQKEWRSGVKYGSKNTTINTREIKKELKQYVTIYTTTG